MKSKRFVTPKLFVRLRSRLRCSFCGRHSIRRSFDDHVCSFCGFDHSPADDLVHPAEGLADGTAQWRCWGGKRLANQTHKV